MKRAAPRIVFAVVVLQAVLTLAAPDVPAWSAEGPRAIKTSYVVLSRSGFPVRIAALEWIPPGAKTVLLAVHGLGAVKENTWGRLVVPGYSLGENEYARGRATVAIDLPGRGESGGNPYLVGFEDDAYVVQQIAFMLRKRFEHVVAIGHSAGGLVVGLAQATFEAMPQGSPLFVSGFDAIIPAAASHTPSESGCKGPTIKDTLFTSYADPRVVDDFLWRLRPPKETFAITGSLYGGGAASNLGPAPDEVTRNVTVPVLLVFGGSDCLFDTSKYGEEPSHYGSSDVTLVVLPRTGHAVFHHLNHRYVDGVIGKWLTRHKL
jgi:pimeloyl-ACP methyl ester carboxylesterase